MSGIPGIPGMPQVAPVAESGGAPRPARGAVLKPPALAGGAGLNTVKAAIAHPVIASMRIIMTSSLPVGRPWHEARRSCLTKAKDPVPEFHKSCHPPADSAGEKARKKAGGHVP